MNQVIGTPSSVWIPRLPREASSAETRAREILSNAQVRIYQRVRNQFVFVKGVSIQFDSFLPAREKRPGRRCDSA
jgi:hypothetical protein